MAGDGTVPDWLLSHLLPEIGGRTRRKRAQPLSRTGSHEGETCTARPAPPSTRNPPVADWIASILQWLCKRALRSAADSLRPEQGRDCPGQGWLAPALAEFPLLLAPAGDAAKRLHHDEPRRLQWPQIAHAYHFSMSANSESLRSAMGDVPFFATLQLSDQANNPLDPAAVRQLAKRVAVTACPGHHARPLAAVPSRSPHPRCFFPRLSGDLPSSATPPRCN